MEAVPTESVITARAYSGCYGGEQANVGDLLVVKVQCLNIALSLAMKQIIFVVDESGSMIDTVPAVQASLFAARNALLTLIEKNTSDEAERDRIFSEECSVSIITFSNTAHCVWESNAACQLQGIHNSPLTFSEAVKAIEADSSTNLGEAIELAFRKKLPNHATWIIILTDGKPNRGTRQTAESYTNLIKTLPFCTKIIPLGYTSEFDPEILSILGTMIYVENEEMIAEILGGIMGEVATCYGMNATIELPSLRSLPQIVNPDELITVPETPEIPRTVIGSNLMDCVYNDRKFMYGHLPWGDVKRHEFSHYQGLAGHITYYDIIHNIQVCLPFTVEAGGEIPDEVRAAYFESAKARIILEIYNQKKARGLNRDRIKRKLDDWKHPLALPHKEEILRLLNLQPSDRGGMMTMLGIASAGRTQTSYQARGPHSTATQRCMAIDATNDFRNSRQPQITPAMPAMPAMPVPLLNRGETIIIDPALLGQI